MNYFSAPQINGLENAVRVAGIQCSHTLVRRGREPRHDAEFSLACRIPATLQIVPADPAGTWLPAQVRVLAVSVYYITETVDKLELILYDGQSNITDGYPACPTKSATANLRCIRGIGRGSRAIPADVRGRGALRSVVCRQSWKS